MAPPHYLPRPPPAPRLFSRLSHASKHSFLSHSSSFEADDERSSIVSFDYPSGRMSPGSSDDDDNSDHTSERSVLVVNGGANSPPARYPGEDTRPTSPKELAGWYAYAFAAEVYVICGQFSWFYYMNTIRTLANL